jgi:hypothetical protein
VRTCGERRAACGRAGGGRAGEGGKRPVYKITSELPVAGKQRWLELLFALPNPEYRVSRTRQSLNRTIVPLTTEPVSVSIKLTLRPSGLTTKS